MESYLSWKLVKKRLNKSQNAHKQNRSNGSGSDDRFQLKVLDLLFDFVNKVGSGRTVHHPVIEGEGKRDYFR